MLSWLKSFNIPFYFVIANTFLVSIHLVFAEQDIDATCLAFVSNFVSIWLLPIESLRIGLFLIFIEFC